MNIPLALLKYELKNNDIQFLYKDHKIVIKTEDSTKVYEIVSEILKKDTKKHLLILTNYVIEGFQVITIL